MSGNLGYTKKFIILKKDFSNMSGLSPKGHGKLEVKGLKGSIAISLENAQDNDYYNVVLISRNTSYDLGKVYTDDNGKAREELVFNLQDLESKGFSIDKINGIVVKRDSNILVGGYIDKDDGLLERYIKQLPMRTVYEEQVIEEPPVEELPVEELAVEELVAEEPIIIEPVFVEPIIEEPLIEVVEVEEPVAEQPVLEQPSPPPITERYMEEILEKVDIDSEQNRRISQRNQTTSYVLNILRYFPYIEPFRIRLEGYNWWKIDFQDEAKGFLPYFSYVVGGDQKSRRSDNYVTSRDLMGIYNHYLFGLYTVAEEVAYYVYAVPGGFYKDEHPHGGSTGFNTWFAGEVIGGYWLLYIDPLTGDVINPINPMIPTE